jgi:hypothetical protein
MEWQEMSLEKEAETKQEGHECQTVEFRLYHESNGNTRKDFKQGYDILKLVSSKDLPEVA